MVNIVNLL